MGRKEYGGKSPRSPKQEEFLVTWLLVLKTYQEVKDAIILTDSPKTYSFLCPPPRFPSLSGEFCSPLTTSYHQHMHIFFSGPFDITVV